MTEHTGGFVAYYRVSTERQGASGLGLDAQRQAVLSYLNGGNWRMVGEFTEVESGKIADRPQLVQALAMCRRRKAKLVIAKLDRLSRNLAFIAALMDSGVEFLAVDNPNANKLTIHILAAVAQHEREAISQRTKAALAEAKRRGKQLGGQRRKVVGINADGSKRYGAKVVAPAHTLDRAREAVQARVEAMAADIMPAIEAARVNGCESLRAIASYLNDQGIPTARGGSWSAVQVARVIERSA